MINSFSKEVKEALKHYVYRLIDPINGETFYVGEGCGDRVFEHVNAVDVDAYYRNKKLAIEDGENYDDSDDPEKIRRIIDIKSKGLNVINVIQRWGMDQDTAFEVESAFIDFYGMNQLTNIDKGHDSDRGMTTVEELENRIKASTFPDYPECGFPFVLIKIKDYWINQRGGHNAIGYYETARKHWNLTPSRANKYPYVIAVRYGICVGIYKIDENGWKRAEDGKKSYFTGTEAPDEIKKLFIGKKMPDHYKKVQRGASYCCDEKDLI